MVEALENLLSLLRHISYDRRAFDGLVVTCTGLQGQEKALLLELGQLCGFTYCGDLLKDWSTVLCVCGISAQTNKKIAAASKWGIPVVGVKWLLDSVAHCNLQSLEGYVLQEHSGRTAQQQPTPALLKRVSATSHSFICPQVAPWKQATTRPAEAGMVQQHQLQQQEERHALSPVDNLAARLRSITMAGQGAEPPEQEKGGNGKGEGNQQHWEEKRREMAVKIPGHLHSPDGSPATTSRSIKHATMGGSSLQSEGPLLRVLMPHSSSHENSSQPAFSMSPTLGRTPTLPTLPVSVNVTQQQELFIPSLHGLHTDALMLRGNAELASISPTGPAPQPFTAATPAAAAFLDLEFHADVEEQDEVSLAGNPFLFNSNSKGDANGHKEAAATAQHLPNCLDGEGVCSFSAEREASSMGRGSDSGSGMGSPSQLSQPWFGRAQQMATLTQEENSMEEGRGISAMALHFPQQWCGDTQPSSSNHSQPTVCTTQQQQEGVIDGTRSSGSDYFQMAIDPHYSRSVSNEGMVDEVYTIADMHPSQIAATLLQAVASNTSGQSVDELNSNSTAESGDEIPSPNGRCLICHFVLFYVSDTSGHWPA
jgi:hypothetical protein